MRVQKLYSKITSSWVKHNASTLPLIVRADGAAAIECPIVHLRETVLIYAGIQVNARSARRQLTARSRAIDEGETRRTCVLVILSPLRCNEKVGILLRIVAAHIHSIKLPRHTSSKQHLIDVVSNAQHRLTIDTADIEEILQFCVDFQIIRHRLHGGSLIDVRNEIEIRHRTPSLYRNYPYSVDCTTT